jgi:gliding motility-associated-like protein
MFPGDVISESQTVYIYVGNGGCFDESSFAITIDQLIMADSLEDVSACDSFTLPALNAGHYFTQSNGTGIEMFPGDILTSSRTIYIYLQSGSCSDEKSFALDVSPTHCPPTPNNEKMIFPKFFTPNNDGINDSWGGTPAENEIRGNVHIFDRLGKLLIKMDINSSSWDGTYKGREMPSSDYWYRFIDSQTGGVITGHFTLKR